MMKEPTKDDLKARAAKILDQFETIRQSPLKVAEYGWLQHAIAEGMCATAIEALKYAAQEAGTE